MGWKARAAVLTAFLAAGCGGAVASEESASVEPTSGHEESRHEDGPQITGLMGTIRSDQVEDALNPRMGRFMRCFEQRMGDVEFLSGNIRMSFRIHTDGTVAWVFPSESDIGDRAAEQCVLEIARSTHFPRPRGGEAEFTWGFGFDAPDDVRLPTSWQEDALSDRQDDIADAARACNAAGDYRVTAYIEPGGHVLSAGGSAPSADAMAGLDCILERVRALEMPDPGSYAAKVTFAVR
jgi:hypothetical protein